MGISFTNPHVRKLMPTYSEASGQRSLRDSDATPRIWQKSLTMDQQIVRLCIEVEQLQRELGRLRIRKGAATSTPTVASTGMVFRGQWSNVVVYDAQNLVFRTPPGGSAGAYIAVLNTIPAGTLPEQGEPWWAAVPYPPAGMWG